jgi:hypothetical protein
LGLKETNDKGGKQSILATDNMGKTVFRVATVFSELDLFQEIFHLAKENLTTVEVKNCN